MSTLWDCSSEKNSGSFVWAGHMLEWLDRYLNNVVVPDLIDPIIIMCPVSFIIISCACNFYHIANRPVSETLYRSHISPFSDI